MNEEVANPETFGLVYCSHALVPFSPAALDDLVSHASENNARLNITGYLCHFNNGFIQYIEGDQDKVLALEQRISRDDRHEIISSMACHPGQNRRFANWSMQHISLDQLGTVQLECTLTEYLEMFDRIGLSASVVAEVRIQQMVDQLAAHRNSFV